MKWNGKEYANWNDRVNEENKNDTEHPTPEQLLMRMAIEELTEKQRSIWDMYAYEQLTQEEIAKALGITQQTVQEKLKAIEAKIEKFCKQNKGAYLLLKLEHKIMNEDE